MYYQTWELSARDGTHHIINTMYRNELTDGGFAQCADLGTGTNSNIIDNLPGASKPYMPRMPIAPENAHIGREIGPNTPSQADMHNFNPTDKDTLREFWMNIYYADESEVTDKAEQIRVFGGLSWLYAPIAIGTDKTYTYSCPINSDGRIIELLGHIHSHAINETASIRRANGDVEKVFEMYDYLEPAQFAYDSVTKNPGFSDSAPGAVSGPIEVHAGDSLEWSCHVVNNDVAGGLRFTNEVVNGEMCIMWGAAVGPLISCNLP